MPTKSRYYRTIVTDSNGNIVPYQDLVSATIEGTNSKLVSGSYRSFNEVSDFKMITPANYLYVPWGWRFDCSQLSTVIAQRKLIYDNAIKKAYLQLDFQENNNFELIPFLMDWDSTIAMFSKKFLKEISYGQVTWGVLPFVSDVKSLVGSLKDINSGLSNSYNELVGKRISRRVPFSDNFNDAHFNFSVTGHINYNGFVSGELMYPNNALDSILILLDELGVNPDLKTLWDVIPLSFAIDYLVPVGDLLETAHPRGWFRPQFVVTGGHSVKATVTLTGLGSTHQGPAGVYSYYVRKPGTLTIGSRPPIDPKFQAPDQKELFNLAYLKTSMSKR